jgi:predicted RNA binding protein YcfA (HicA-like mRNA interferase family)
MARFPRLRGREIIAALQRAGFRVLRIKGSHHFMQHSDGRLTVVPIHAGETIGPGLLSKILKDGGAEGIRTPDPHNAIVVLYQLSYDPIRSGLKSRGATGPCQSVSRQVPNFANPVGCPY